MAGIMRWIPFSGKIQKIQNKVLLKNYFYLSILQIVNYIFPVITVPYLIRVIGVEAFGLINFSQSLVSLFFMLTDYGFTLSGARRIAIYKNDSEIVEESFNAMLFISIIFSIFYFFILTIIVFSFERFYRNWQLYYLSYSMVLGNVLFPIWFFQGMEKMIYIPTLNAVIKSSFLVLIFLFVRKREDYLLVPLFNSLGFFLSGVLALIFIRFKFCVKFRLPSRQAVKECLKEGWNIFLSRIAVNLYTQANVFLLGIFTSDLMVGQYVVSLRIIGMFRIPFTPMYQAIYPYLIYRYEQSQKDFLSFSGRIVILMLGVTITISLVVFIFSHQLVYIFTGSSGAESLYYLRILTLSFVFAPFGELFTQMLLVQKQDKLMLNLIFVAMILNFVLNFTLIPLFGATGLACTMVGIALYIFVSKSYFAIIRPSLSSRS